MNNYLRRQIQPIIESKLGSGKVIIITGPRRVGKTILIKQLQSNFQGKSIFLNGEDLTVQELLSRRSTEHYRSLLGDAKLFLLDEAQAIGDVGKILKLMIDEIPELDIIATGSSSFELSNQTGEPLTGRKYHFDLYPFSHSEFSNYENKVETYMKLESRIVYGAYPEVALMENSSAKIEYLTEMVRSYLLKDILAFEQIKSSAKLMQLMQLIAFQVGKEVSLEELSRQLNLHRTTVERYLDLLSKVFVIYRLGAFSTNLRKEIVKSSKWYFYDNGIRNAIIGDFTLLPSRRDVGQLWENYLVSERLKQNSNSRLPAEYFFWRTYDQQEIDFIERNEGKLSAFEFKWKEKVSKPPVFFQKSYPDVPFSVIHNGNYLDFIL